MGLASRLMTVMFANEPKAEEDLDQEHSARFPKMSSLTKGHRSPERDYASQVANLQAQLSMERRERETGERELKETRELLTRLEGAMEQQAKVAAIDQAHLAALEGALAKQKEKVGTSFAEEDPEPRVQRLQGELEEERLRREQAENQLEEMRKLLTKLEETIQEQAKVTQLDQEQQDKMAVIVEAWSDERKRASGLQATIDELEVKLQAETEKVSTTTVLLKQQSQEIQDLQEKLIAKDNRVCDLQRSLQDELAKIQAANDQLIDKERLVLDLRRRMSECVHTGGSSGVPPLAPRTMAYPPGPALPGAAGFGGSETHDGADSPIQHARRVQASYGSGAPLPVHVASNSYTAQVGGAHASSSYAIPPGSVPPTAPSLASSGSSKPASSYNAPSGGSVPPPMPLDLDRSPSPAPPPPAAATGPRTPRNHGPAEKKPVRVDITRAGQRPSCTSSSRVMSPRRQVSKEPAAGDQANHEAMTSPPSPSPPSRPTLAASPPSPTRTPRAAQGWTSMVTRGTSSNNLAAQAYAAADLEVQTSYFSSAGGPAATQAGPAPTPGSSSLVGSVSHVAAAEVPCGLKSRQASDQLVGGWRSAMAPVATSPPAGVTTPYARVEAHSPPVHASDKRTITTTTAAMDLSGVPPHAQAPATQKRTMARQRLYVAFPPGQANGESSAAHRRLALASRSFT